ncbi:MAG TPA: hypothetical protein VIT45_14560 [Allosphingosinicella sp.]
MSSDHPVDAIIGQGRWLIPSNPHLHVGGPALAADKLLMVREAAVEGLKRGMAEARESNLVQNLASVSEEFIRRVCDLHGEKALLRLFILASGHEPSEFKHFREVIDGELWLGRVADESPPRQLSLDNAQLRASPEIDRFCHNVVNSGLSRKLYIPGRREGFVVYGLGGPRILLSLRFHGTDRYHYPVFQNTIDVVTSLQVRGYFGNYLALDRLDGLAAEYGGLPGWLVWFSYLASQSDLIIFITEKGKGLSPHQIREGQLTPDRVPKKIVEFEEGELRWGKASRVAADQDLGQTYFIPERGFVSEAEYLASERAFAEEFIELYDRGSFPNDRLIALHEDGRILEYPLENLAG